MIKLILNWRGFVVVQENGERFSQTHKHFKLSTSGPVCIMQGSNDERIFLRSIHFIGINIHTHKSGLLLVEIMDRRKLRVDCISNQSWTQLYICTALSLLILNFYILGQQLLMRFLKLNLWWKRRLLMERVEVVLRTSN